MHVRWKHHQEKSIMNLLDALTDLTKLQLQCYAASSKGLDDWTEEQKIGLVREIKQLSPADLKAAIAGARRLERR
jgi:hypothetical protein